MLSNELKRALRFDLIRQAPVFDTTRPRHPALAQQEDVAAVLDLLADDREQAYDAKEGVVRAALVEFQAAARLETGPRPSSFWSGLLLYAFYPMLRHLRSTVRPGPVDRDELDHVILEAFLGAASSLDCQRGCKRVGVWLKSRTRRRVFQRLRAEAHANLYPPTSLASAQEDARDVSARPRRRRAQRPRFVEDEQDEAARLLTERVGPSLRPAYMDLILSTQVRGENLRAVVNRLHPEATAADRERIYERLKRQHSRARARVRKLLHRDTLGVPVCTLPGSSYEASAT